VLSSKFQKSSTTGVSGASEFVEINDATWEVLTTLIGNNKYWRFK
jgi:hypothetical protein